MPEPRGWPCPDGPALAVDLGATHLRVAVAADQLGPVVVRRTRDLAPQGSGTELVAAIAEVAAAVAEATCPGRRPAAVGVGVAAFVDPGGALHAATPYGVPAGDALNDAFAAALGVPVVVDNDAKMAALGELTSGVGVGRDSFVLVTLGTNIGGALVLDGHVVRGAHGTAGEVGMLLVRARRGPGGRGRVADAGRFGRAETAAGPGYAWLEELVGGGALARSSLPPGLAPEASPGVFARAAAGDRRARAAIARAVEGWAMLVADLAAVLDPPLVILSGGLVAEADHFLEPLRERVRELTPFPPEIRSGALGASAGLVGAAVAARRVIGTPEARHDRGDRGGPTVTLRGQGLEE
ncbi:MAG TPA: ROK family protein [Candidatus Limnocylindrales bacterium]